MKYKLLVFAAICAMFSSCSKDSPSSSSGSSSGSTPAQEVEKTIDFILVSLTSQQAYLDQQFEFDFNGTKISFKESDMKEVTDSATLKQIPGLILSTNKGLKFMEDKKTKVSVQYLKYTLGKLKQGQKVSSVSRTAIVKSDRPSSSFFDFFSGYTIIVNGKEGLNEVNYHKGVYNTDPEITSFFKSLFKSFSVSYTCN